MRHIRELGSLPSDAFIKYHGLPQSQVGLLCIITVALVTMCCDLVAVEESSAVQCAAKEIQSCQQESFGSVCQLHRA